MNINRQESLNAQIAVTNTDGNGTDTTTIIANCYASVNNTDMSMNMGINGVNKVAVNDPANATAINQQFLEFQASVYEAAAAAGLTMFAKEAN
jgi:hypothetical protein